MPVVLNGKGVAVERNKNLRVLMLDPSGSGAMVTHNLCNYLAQLGCEVEVYSAPHWARTVDGSKRNYRLNVMFYRKTQLQSYVAKNSVTRLMWKIARLVDHTIAMWKVARKAREADIIHAHFFPVPLIDYLYLRLISRRVPLACTVHETVPHDSRFRALTRAFFCAIYRLADILFEHTEHTRAQLIDEFEIPASRIVRIRIGKLEHLLTKTLGVSCAPDSCPAILFIGHIRKDKGLEVLVNAASRLMRRIEEFKIIVAGRPGYDLSSIHELVDNLGVNRVFDFQLGYLSESRFADYLRSAAVVVLPYRRVEQSAVAIAACTFGKAIVATRCGGLEELLNEAGNGILVPVDDPVALADALAAVLEDDVLRKQFEACSAAYAETELSLNTQAELTLRAYQRAVDGRGIADLPRQAL